MTVVDMDGLFKCEVCGFETWERLELEKHLQTEHQEFWREWYTNNGRN